jgi:hypothetical protein
MKHLLKIEKFINEALTPHYKKVYNKISKDRAPEVIARLNHLLDNKERVYIPYNPITISETQLKVSSYLEELGYNILDYRGNSAVQIENNKRQIRISKLLAKNPELLKEFTLDDTRANTKSGSEFSIVLTSNYEDVAGMSFDRCWGSCMNLRDGENKHYVQFDVMEGTIIAYLIKSDDLNVDNPLGRIAIKPYFCKSNEEEIIYIPDTQVYGNVPDLKTFFDVVNDYIKQKQIIKTPGFYNKYWTLYSDSGSREVVMVKKDGTFCYTCEFDEEGYDYEGYNEEGYNKEGYDRYGKHINDGYPYQEYLTKKQYLFLRKYTAKYYIWRDVDNSIPKVTIDHLSNYEEEGHYFSITPDGLIDVNGSVRIFDNCEYLPVKFGKVVGLFECRYNGLKSLEGAPVEVGGSFDVEGNKLTSMKGVSKRVNGHIDISNNVGIVLDDFPEFVGGKLRMRDCELTSLGNKIPKKVESLDCTSNNLKSLEGSPIEVLGFFSVTYNKLTNLIGGPVKVGNGYSCYGNELTSLEGSPLEVTDFDFSDNKLDSFKGLENTKILGNLDCTNNQFKNIEYLPQIKNLFYGTGNIPKFDEKEVRKITGADRVVV